MALNSDNAFIMHLMYVEIFEILKQKKIGTPRSWKLVLERMRRFGQFTERLISPEGIFSAF
jgi:hypothetical protein